MEKASRSTSAGVITPDNLEPNPKNPIIASFFRNIGLADQLGPGVRNLFKCSKYYSGKDPEFEEGDVFKITVPLESLGETQVTPKVNPSYTQDYAGLSEKEKRIVQIITEEPQLTQKEIAEQAGYNVNSVKTLMRGMKTKGILLRKGTSQKGR